MYVSSTLSSVRHRFCARSSMKAASAALSGGWQLVSSGLPSHTTNVLSPQQSLKTESLDTIERLGCVCCTQVCPVPPTARAVHREVSGAGRVEGARRRLQTSVVVCRKRTPGESCDERENQPKAMHEQKSVGECCAQFGWRGLLAVGQASSYQAAGVAGPCGACDAKYLPPHSPQAKPQHGKIE